MSDCVGCLIVAWIISQYPQNIDPLKALQSQITLQLCNLIAAFDSFAENDKLTSSSSSFGIIDVSYKMDALSITILGKALGVIAKYWIPEMIGAIECLIYHMNDQLTAEGCAKGLIAVAMLDEGRKFLKSEKILNLLYNIGNSNLGIYVKPIISIIQYS